MSSQRFSSRHLPDGALSSDVRHESRHRRRRGAWPVAYIRVGAGPSIDDMDDALGTDFDLRIGAKPMNFTPSANRCSPSTAR